MSWDTDYRPRVYEDVLGQEATVSVLRQIVKSRRGFHQSYLFTGPFGTGKTTLGRILARALLCHQPLDGNPCEECISCKELLQKGSSECFSEIDAATNSGKEGIKKILETLDFATFTGSRRIYLFDESHQLSRDALDALLKPLEDTEGDSGERRLVCIFCTTEPEKMRETIGSRCGPTFAIRTAPPERIADRLGWICEQEGASYERPALIRVAEGVEGHIRDAIKACEMLSMQGDITLASVEHYLGQDLNGLYLDILEGLQGGLGGALEALDALLIRTSPASIYETLARVCLLSYKVSLGIGRAASYWDSERLQSIGRGYGGSLLDLSELFSSKPRRPTKDMLQCDLLSVHRRFRDGIAIGGGGTSSLPVQASTVVLSHQDLSQATKVVQVPAPPKMGEPTNPLPSDPEGGTNYLTRSGVYVPPWGMSRNRLDALQGLKDKGTPSESPGVAASVPPKLQELSPQSYSLLVSLRASELAGRGLEADAFCSLVRQLLLDLNSMRSVDQGGIEAKAQQEEANSQTVL